MKRFDLILGSMVEKEAGSFVEYSEANRVVKEEVRAALEMDGISSLEIEAAGVLTSIASAYTSEEEKDDLEQRLLTVAQGLLSSAGTENIILTCSKLLLEALGRKGNANAVLDYSDAFGSIKASLTDKKNVAKH